jgi:hypothetical protein
MLCICQASSVQWLVVTADVSWPAMCAAWQAVVTGVAAHMACAVLSVGH